MILAERSGDTNLKVGSKKSNCYRQRSPKVIYMEKSSPNSFLHRFEAFIKGFS